MATTLNQPLKQLKDLLFRLSAFAGATLGPDRPDTLKLPTPFMAVAEDGFLSFRHATRLLKAMKTRGLGDTEVVCLEGCVCLIGSVWFDEHALIHYT